MKTKLKDYSKKKVGQHKVRGPAKNRKQGVSPQARQAPTPTDQNQADRDLGSLLGN